MQTRRRPHTSPTTARAVRAAMALAAVLGLLLATTPASQAAGNSKVAAMCRQGAWQQLMGADGTLFTNTGACVSYGAHGGSIVPRGGPPTATDDAVTLGANLDAVVDVLANDHDPDGDPLSVAVGDPTHGTATVLPDGTVRYTPAIDFAGEDSFTYRVDDGRGGSDTATVTLTVVASPVSVIAVSPDHIDHDITVQIMVIIGRLPAGATVTEVRFRHGDDQVSVPPDLITIPTRVPATLPRLWLTPGTYDVVVVTDDGRVTAGAVLTDGLTVTG